MDFYAALKAALDGKEITLPETCNGSHPRLVAMKDGAFLQVPRRTGAGKDNFVFCNITPDQYLSDQWKEEER